MGHFALLVALDCCAGKYGSVVPSTKVLASALLYASRIEPPETDVEEGEPSRGWMRMTRSPSSEGSFRTAGACEELLVDSPMISLIRSEDEVAASLALSRREKM